MKGWEVKVDLETVIQPTALTKLDTKILAVFRLFYNHRLEDNLSKTSKSCDLNTMCLKA